MRNINHDRICPVPGYDKHFRFCRFAGIEMIPVPLAEDGPDMDLVEKLAAEDEEIKGMWCMPKFSNPYGCCYSDETVRRLARMKTAAADFRLFWDDAYRYHWIYKDHQVLDILKECKACGNPDRPFLFGSTSKITMAGSGVTFIAGSKANIDFIKKQFTSQTVGWDKMNMLRTVRFLQDIPHLKEHMAKYAEIIRPKFDAVLNTFDRELSGTGAGDWTKPDGGYFITFAAYPGCAKRIVELCRETGVIITSAGEMHPSGVDPEDKYIRIAPTYPPLSELKDAMEIFSVCVRLAAAEKRLAEKDGLQ
ncbi:MAG: aminotransferase class I/II-fold pyridoxal phosphate-dependent enzyme [Lachnospiraceae bacterium]|nr:aminotransferase class I/II-fold pyridoxal phosphate-dependent enzyme [Lachnospiraceae bacterium]